MLIYFADFYLLINLKNLNSWTNKKSISNWHQKKRRRRKPL